MQAGRLDMIELPGDIMKVEGMVRFGNREYEPKRSAVIRVIQPGDRNWPSIRAAREDRENVRRKALGLARTAIPRDSQRPLPSALKRRAPRTPAIAFHILGLNMTAQYTPQPLQVTSGASRVIVGGLCVTRKLPSYKMLPTFASVRRI